MKDLETFTAPKESSRACTGHDDLSGRWVSKNHFAPPTLEPGSPFFDWIQTQVSSHPFSLYPPCRGRPSIAATDEFPSLAVQSFFSSDNQRIPSRPSPRLPKLRLRLHSLQLQDPASINFRMARRSETGYSTRDWRCYHSRLLLSELGIRRSRCLPLLNRLGLS